MKMKEREDFYQYLNCFSFAFVSHSCPLFLQKQWKGNAGLFWIRRIGHWIPSELKSYFPNPLKDTNFLILGGLQILEFGPYVSLPDNMFVTIFFFFLILLVLIHEFLYAFVRVKQSAWWCCVVHHLLLWVLIVTRCASQGFRNSVLNRNWWFLLWIHSITCLHSYTEFDSETLFLSTDWTFSCDLENILQNWNLTYWVDLSSFQMLLRF